MRGGRRRRRDDVKMEVASGGGELVDLGAIGGRGKGRLVNHPRIVIFLGEGGGGAVSNACRNSASV